MVSYKESLEGIECKGVHCDEGIRRGHDERMKRDYGGMRFAVCAQRLDDFHLIPPK